MTVKILGGSFRSIAAPGDTGEERTIMGDPEDEAQQPAPDPEQPDDGGAEPDNTWEGSPTSPPPPVPPAPPTPPDDGGIEPDNTWEG
jgi:hypothetical protein